MLRSESRAVLWAAIVVALGLPVLPAAGQATITVDTAADNTTAGDGACTLREAITNANANSDTTSGDCAAGVGATDGIVFGIGGGGSVATIQPASQLPTITEGVTIDGTTQGCGSGPCIELDGDNENFGPTITGPNSTIRGLVINRFGEVLIRVQTTGTTIVGNYLGTDITGTADLSSAAAGVRITGSANTIGGTTPGAGNVISGNGTGVWINGGDGNVVLGNLIGTDVTGIAALGNIRGVFIHGGGENNTIGGTGAGAGNVISGNINAGVEIFGSGTTGNVVQGNLIGTDITGTADLGNGAQGVNLIDSAAGNTIGGAAPGAGNVISGNTGDGVVIQHAGTTGNTVSGNLIGTDASGTAALGNSSNGVWVGPGATGNTIGGATQNAGNLVAHNAGDGVECQDNQSNTIAHNTISNNGDDGVTLELGAGDNTVSNNAIFENGGRGVAVHDANTVAAGKTSLSGTGNTISENEIYANVLLGIDLNRDGATANDAGDPDTGPNNLQNFPTLTAALINTGGTLLVTYAVDTDPAHAAYPLAVEFFEADAADEEGRTFLGSDSYATGHHPGTRQVNLGSAAALGVSTGDRLVATATDAAGNTSEFSPARVSNGTRYVATTGSDAGNTCINPASPCATLTHVVGQANAGDTLDIAAGTYHEPGLVIDKALHIQGQGVVVE